MSRKIAIVLFNLGGPERLEDVRPFLKNLFSDKAIIRLLQPFRWLVAGRIAKQREEAAQANYSLIGGGSPLLEETTKQARALEAELTSGDSETQYKCFIAMRHWHPLTEETAAEISAWSPDETVLLPLYPHFSSTTTGSSIVAWLAAYDRPCRTICCYPDAEDLIDAHADLIMQSWEQAGEPGNVSLLMSAHGLPEKIVAAGDPYKWQIETMGAALAARLPRDWEIIGCFQSRVGPLKWIGPSTDEIVRRISEAGRNIIIAPIAFVSEHVETLVELDIEYRELAEKSGAASYTRVPALSTYPKFIALLARLVTASLSGATEIRSCRGGRICPHDRTDCPNHRAAA